MPEAATAEPPPTETQKSHVEESKSIFRKAMEDVAGKPQEVSTEATQATTTEKPVDTKLVAALSEEKPKSAIPEDVISPAKDEPEKEKPDEVIAAIDAMELPKGASKTQVASFGELRQKAKERIESQKSRIKELEEKIGQSSNKADIEALQSKITAA